MAFGVNYFIYYTYQQMSDTKDAIVDINCQPTFRYYAAKTVNNEVLYSSAIFLISFAVTTLTPSP